MSSASDEVAQERLGLSQGKLDQIADEVAEFNRDTDVMGMLLLNGEGFLNIYEGAR